MAPQRRGCRHAVLLPGVRCSRCGKVMSELDDLLFTLSERQSRPIEWNENPLNGDVFSPYRAFEF